MTKNKAIKNIYTKTFKKESKKAFNFLKKNRSLSFFFLGWIMIILGSLDILNLLFGNIFWSFSLNPFLSTMGFIIILIASVFFVYTGFGILHYKSWVLTTLFLFFFFQTLGIFILQGFNFFIPLLQNILIVGIIFLWVTHNKTLFKK